MITLITGVPGAGKTAWLIAQLLRLQINQPHRRMLAHGIKEFKLSHKQIFCTNRKCEMCQSNELVVQSLKYRPDEQIKFNERHDLLFLEDWVRWKKPNDLIVADEVQRVWPSKNGASAVMDSISLLDTHRHHGIDFWVLSQSPKLIHTDVRQFVNRHIHLAGNWAGRKEYEWPEVHENVLSRADAVERPYKLPKHVYRFYKSAEVHTKLEKRKPMSFYAAIFSLVLVVLMVGYVGNRVYQRTQPAVPVVSNEHETPPEGVGASAPAPSGGVDKRPLDLSTPEQVAAALTPVVEGVPWTAPIYKDLVKPVALPVVKGCIKSKNVDSPKCSCYTQQGTIVSMPFDVCSSLVNRKVFNPFQPDKRQHDNSQVVASN